MGGRTSFVTSDAASRPAAHVPEVSAMVRTGMRITILKVAYTVGM